MVVALVGAALLVAAVAWRGRSLLDGGVGLFLGAPPFAGTWTWRWPSWEWAAAAGAGLLVLVWPRACRRLAWPQVLAGSGVVALAWPTLLALTAGTDRLARPLTSRFEYLPLARRVEDPAAFVRTFVARLGEYPTHVRGHPPGPVLVLRALDRLVGGSDVAVAVVVLAVAATAAPASLVALDRLAGRDAARRAAVFAGLAPAAIWIATSPDAMFMGVAAWSLALAAVAVTSGGRVGVAAGAGAGLSAGLVATLTYGAPALLAPTVAVTVLGLLRRRWGPLVAIGAGSLVGPVALAVAGFDWAGGARATRDAYRAGVASERPFSYFVLANLAVLAVAVGPAAVAGIAGLRDRAAWCPVGGALAGVVVADLSGLSKGEVERIWLPLVPALVLATTSLPVRWQRPALAAQLLVAVGLQAWLGSPW